MDEMGVSHSVAAAARRVERAVLERQTCVPLRAVRPVAGVVTHVGKAPPLREMAVSRLTRGRLFGRIRVLSSDLSRLCRTCGPPLQAGCFVSRLYVSSESQSLCAIGHSAP